MAASRSVASSRLLQSVMSRAIVEAPITAPAALRIGDTVIDTSISLPSFRLRTVSSSFTDSPLRTRSKIVGYLVLSARDRKDSQWPADCLIRRIPEHSLRGAIPTYDETVQVSTYDRVVTTLDERGEMIRRRLRVGFQGPKLNGRG